MFPRRMLLLGMAFLIPACGGGSGSGSGGLPAAGPSGLLLGGGATGSSLHYLTAVGPLLFFIYDDGVHGSELWKSDGTPEGTGLVKDIFPGPTSSRPNNLMALGPILLFYADDGVHGLELWRSDGTESGTTMVVDLNPGAGNGPLSVGPGTSTVLGSILLFPGTDGGAHVGLWKTDGTAAGTQFLAATEPGGGSAGPAIMATGTSIAYFFGYDQGLGTNSIWKSDGNVAGTVHILDVQAPSNLIVSGTVAYFRALDPVNGLQPWKSDGTPAGTLMVKAIGTSSSSPRNFMAVGSLVFFAAITGTENLWQTDGTAAGTVMVQPSPAQPAPNWFTDTGGMGVFGSELYFKATDNLYPWELWKTDGTLTGTVRVVTSPPNLNPNGMTAFGSSVFFAGTDAAHGTELWSSDGTAAGTQLVWDLNPGPASSTANQFTVVGSSLFFTAKGGSGISLWKYPP